MLPLVVRAGGGSARDTLSILDQLIAGSDADGIRYDRAVALLGYTDASLLDEIVDAFAAADGAAVFRAVNRVIEGGHEPRRFATDLLDRFRDLIVLASVPDAISSGLLDVPPDRADALQRPGRAVRPGVAHPRRRHRRHRPRPDARRHLAAAAARADVRAGAAARRRDRRAVGARPARAARVGRVRSRAAARYQGAVSGTGSACSGTPVRPRPAARPRTARPRHLAAGHPASERPGPAAAGPSGTEGARGARAAQAGDVRGLRPRRRPGARTPPAVRPG